MNLSLLLYLTVGFLGAVRTERDGFRVVTIDQGPVRGYKIQDSNVYGFFGIPYATEPTGTDKFKAPLPPPSWNDTFEANREFIPCPQPHMVSSTHDNCLIANVYVPDTNITNLPVVVMIHGGAFQVGIGNYGSPINLINTRDIIVVNFNYRLGVHGFLCLGNEDAPGNAAMKDQLAALRWVKRNIRVFGGNPDDITISGCSAGGVSVDLLRIVNITDGLFNKVITGSGASLAAFGVQVDPIENAKLYARELGFNNVDDISALTEFYKTATLELLISKADIIMNRPDAYVLFSPCVEKDIGVEMFLDDAPINIIKKGMNKALPVLYGVADMEGLMFSNEFDNWKNIMNENFTQVIPESLEFENYEERESVANEIKKFYFGDQPVTNESFVAIVKYYSDTVFVYPMLRSVKLHADTSNDSKFYIFEFSFIHPTHQKMGADHCDQYDIMFDDEDESSLPEDFKNVKALIRKIHTDFIVTGNPVLDDSVLPPWPQANSSRDPYMSIGVNITLEGAYDQKHAEFWDRIYEKYYRPPIPPSGNKSSMIAMCIAYYYVIFIHYFM